MFFAFTVCSAVDIEPRAQMHDKHVRHLCNHELHWREIKIRENFPRQAHSFQILRTWFLQKTKTKLHFSNKYDMSKLKFWCSPVLMLGLNVVWYLQFTHKNDASQCSSHLQCAVQLTLSQGHKCMTNMSDTSAIMSCIGKKSRSGRTFQGRLIHSKS